MNKKTLWIGIAILVLAWLAVAAYFFFGKQSGQKTSGIINNVGKQAYVYYVWTFEDGSVFDTNKKEVAEKNGLYTLESDQAWRYEPLKFTVGAGQMIAWFDKAVANMKIWESKKVTLQPSDAYGEYQSGLVQTMPRSQFQESNIVPKVGDAYQSASGAFTILEVTQDEVKVDYNSKMAGKVLVFDITLEAIDEPQTPIIVPQTSNDEEKKTDQDTNTNTESTANPDQTGAKEPATTPEPTGLE